MKVSVKSYIIELWTKIKSSAIYMYSLHGIDEVPVLHRVVEEEGGARLGKVLHL